MTFTLILNQDIQEHPTINNYYKYVDHTSPGGSHPSRCDCDYKEIELHLSEDFSFVLKEQKGRLTILSLDSLFGTWQINSPNELQLTIDSLVRDSKYTLPDFTYSKPTRYNTSRVEKIKISNYQLVYDHDKVLLPIGKPIKLDKKNHQKK